MFDVPSLSNNRARFAWTTQAQARLVELAKQKLSASRICQSLLKEFGGALSRSAVIGRASRTRVKLGEHGVNAATAEERREKKIRVEREKNAERIRKRRAQLKAAQAIPPHPVQIALDRAPYVEEPETLVLLAGGYVKFLDADADQCRWVLDRGTLEYAIVCGKTTQPGSSYCPECHSRVWVKARQPERKAHGGGK